MAADHAHHDHDTHGAHGADDPDQVFNQAFDAEVKEALMKEDSEAWNNVTGELLTIVTLGVAFFIFIVLVISR